MTSSGTVRASLHFPFMSDDRSSASDDERLAQTNSVLAEWAARSAANSETLVARLEGMGYELRGKSEDEIAEILKRPPGRPTVR